MGPEPLPAGITADHVGALIERLRRIPDETRDFIMTPDEAWQYLRVSAALQEHLIDNGLPVRGAGDSTRFDVTDMRNVAMRMGGSARSARRFWAAGMNRGGADGPAHYEFQYSVSCPQPGHGGTCKYVFLLPGKGHVEKEVPAGTDAPAPVAQVSIEPDWPALPDEARDLLDLLQGVDFMRLPASLREDTDFIRRAHLGDCLGTTRILVEEGQKRGLPVRSRYGIMVVLPYSNRHNWAEFNVDGRWVPVDPVLLRWMVEWGVVDGAEWDAYRSPGAILTGISATKRPLVTHNGDEIRSTLVTERLRQEA